MKQGRVMFRHYDNTYKDFTYNINECDITYVFFIYFYK